jgi:hypothetical protein
MGLLKANIDFAMNRPDMALELESYLRSILN